jgi:hypothetical protein
MDSLAPEFDSKIALEIVQKYQVLDEEQFDKETDITIPYESPWNSKEANILPKSTRKDHYIVHTVEEKQELKRALNHLFESNAVHYKKRIVLEE